MLQALEMSQEKTQIVTFDPNNYLMKTDPGFLTMMVGDGEF